MSRKLNSGRSERPIFQSVKNFNVFTQPRPEAVILNLLGFSVMNVVSHSLYADHYIPLIQTEFVPPESGDCTKVEFIFSSNIDAEVEIQKTKQLEVIGRSEFVAKGNFGFSHEARVHASSIGASVAIVGTWPAKLKAIRRQTDGSIDIQSILADPPLSISSGSNFVVRAIFLRNKI